MCVGGADMIEMEDTRAVRSQISAILDECSPTEIRRIYEFAKNVKNVAPDKTTVTRTPKKVVQENLEGITIDYLCQRTNHFGTIAKWLHDSYYKDKKSYEQVLNMIKIANAAMLPIRLVALSNNVECAGTISIIADEEFAEQGFTPMIHLLYVPEKFRDRGIERKLIEQSKKVLKGLGKREVFIKKTGNEKNNIINNGTWEKVGSFPNRQQQMTQIFKATVIDPAALMHN